MTREAKVTSKMKLAQLYGHKCFYCGEGIIPANMTIDHFVPKKMGGGDEIENLRPSCNRCNYEKGHLDTKWFLRKTELMIVEKADELKRLKSRSKKLAELITWS